jgi:hypothetical protein
MRWSRKPVVLRRLAPRMHSLLVPATAGGKAVALGAVVVLAAGSASLAAQTAFGSAGPRPSAAQPELVANTPAPCNRPQPKGYARCFAIVRTPSDHQITPDQSGPPSTALTPADLQSAYKLPSATAGGGQTVALVDAGNDPDAASNLATFRSYWGLPACTTANGCFRKVNEEGHQGNYPPDLGWGDEISLDLDTVSSACPKCNILLVEANSTSVADLGTSVDEAVKLGATAVSNSYGLADQPGETGWDHYYNHPGVAVTASAGDDGYGVNYPSASPYVTAAGGTTLTKDSSVARGWDETVWGNGTEGAQGDGTGSGCSGYEPQPDFQADIPQLDAVCSNRATTDVSADANPASGLAIYDTDGEGGWLQVGGTSLASPLIAASYALAGKPVSGTYPNSYPYHDPNQSSDLFDITSGSNGNCGNVLCNAGKGWDGPTGLGTPDGVKAFRGAPQGQISGQVTDKATGKPVTGATVTAEPGDYFTRTDASGNYDLTLAGGTYTLTTTAYGYHTGTQSGVQVTVNKTVTENFALTAEPPGMLSGTVTDGSGHGWPLQAQITIPGYPAGSVWTSPYTGKYRVHVDQGTYTLTVSTDYPGYQQKQIKVTVGAATTQDITLDADLTSCTAPGYGPEGLTQDFAGWTGATPQDGWGVTGRGPSQQNWRFDNPGDQPPPPSGSIKPIPGTNGNEYVYFDPDHFAIADASYFAPRPLDTVLTSAPADLSGQKSPEILFDSAYYPGAGQDTAQVQLSTDGGHTWTTVWYQRSGNALGPISIPIPQAAGKAGVEARWVFNGSGYSYWEVGDVLIGSPTCVAQPGGLVAGVVTGKTTGTPIGAQVTDAAIASPPPYPWPEGIAEATTDPAFPGGFYWLFTPAGRQKLAAAEPGYQTGTATVGVQANRVIQQNWALAPAATS